MSSSRLEIFFDGAVASAPLHLEIPPDQTASPLTSLLAENGHPLNMRCGGRGLCAGCQIQLLEGVLRHIPTGQTISAADTTASLSACQHSLNSNTSARIRVPITSQTGHAAQIADEFKTRIAVAQAPLFEAPAIAAAIDIGTTTVALLLANVATGQILARATALNHQFTLGDNVVTRINHCMTDKSSIATLQKLIVTETILPLLKQACSRAHLKPSAVAGIVLSGNTIMLHLAAGIDPSAMGVAPFTPTFLEHRRLTAPDLGLEPTLAAATAIHLLPSLSAYVGADINSGIVATGMHYEDGPNLLVDIGTNGEIVLKTENHLLGCATAAGPAFEGAGLTCGTQAISGAISKIGFRTEPFSIQLEMIHGEQNKSCPGICGSAYIDFMGEGVRHGLLTMAGRFSEEFVTAHPEYFQTIDDEKIFVLRDKDHAQPQLIGISERDISRILQAKAAIAAGISTLLAQAGVEPIAIRKLYLAGGFGLHLNVPNAISCGLLPGFTAEQIEVVGNTSLAGAYMVLQDRGILDELQKNQGRVEIVELNLDPTFEDRYIENLLLEVD